MDNIVRQMHHVINGYTVHVTSAVPKPQSTHRSEHVDPYGNYPDEGRFRTNPAQYDYHGNKIFIMIMFHSYDLRFC